MFNFEIQVSIVTPVLNGDYFIRQNIESILCLDIPHEHIIVDGGSNDQTLSILNDYQHLIVLHQTEKTGMYGAIDMGFRVAKGRYICWVNCDDQIIPFGFKKMYEYAIAKKLDFVCSDGLFEYAGENRKKKIKGTHIVRYLLRKGIFPFSQPSAIYKRNLYFDVGGLDYNHFKICGDMDLFWRFAHNKGKCFGYIKVTSSIFLKYGESLGDKGTQLGIDELALSKVNKPSKMNVFLHRLVRLFGI